MTKHQKLMLHRHLKAAKLFYEGKIALMKSTDPTYWKLKDALEECLLTIVLVDNMPTSD